jgi:SAM-dependent methyltransferase
MIESHTNARALFDKTADDYQQRSERGTYNFSSLIFQRRIDIVKEFIDRMPASDNVLDYGMGPAVFGPACVSRGIHYIGVDISPEMVDRGRAMQLPNSEFVVGDLESLRSYRRRMDGVLAIGLLDYLEEPMLGIEALADCVKPGGYIVLSFRNRWSVPRILRDVSKAIVRTFRRSKRDDTRAFFANVHERPFDFRTELRPKLASLGFDSLEVRYFNCSPVFFNFPVPKRLWQWWYRWDRRWSIPAVRGLCSGGVLIARRIGPPK